MQDFSAMIGDWGHWAFSYGASHSIVTGPVSANSHKHVHKEYAMQWERQEGYPIRKMIQHKTVPSGIEIGCKAQNPS
jgi:hypothetical protein